MPRKHPRKLPPAAERPAESDANSVSRPAQPSDADQSGSAGRRAVDDTQPAGPDTGQGHYGQNGVDVNKAPPQDTPAPRRRRAN